MSRTRSSTNPPEYFYTLKPKQQKNWMKSTRKMEKNELLRGQYPAFHSASNIDVIYVHYQSTLTQIEQLIDKAEQTKLYVVDTECQKGETKNQGALIQILFIHSINYSTMMIMKTKFLPEEQSKLFKKIKELCAIIFNNNNGIISWGPIDEEFKHFHHLNLIRIGKINEYDLQLLFSNPDIKPITHPEMEKRDELTRCSFIYDTPGDNDNIFIDDDDDDDNELDYDYYDKPVRSNSYQPISLQDAIAATFERFIDKSMTINQWKCEIDLNLNTWKNKLFSHGKYDQIIEQQERNKMLQYAINDCTSVAELFFHLYPEKINNCIAPPEPEKPTSSKIILENDNDVSDISDDELPAICVPRFDKQTKPLSLPQNNEQSNSTLSFQMDQSNILITEVSTEEMYQIITPEEKQRLKSERQKKKNEKFTLVHISTLNYRSLCTLIISNPKLEPISIPPSV